VHSTDDNDTVSTPEGRIINDSESNNEEEEEETTISKRSSPSTSSSSFPKDGIPLEVIVINEYNEQSSSIKGRTQQPQPDHGKADPKNIMIDAYQTLLESYKHKLESSERLNDSLNDYLQKTHKYVEDLVHQRDELLEVVEEIENEESQRNDQELLLKVVVLFTLLVFVSGGSHQYLVAAVLLQMFVTLVNIVL
jgi:predicted RNase H-like nuclease (RuvC/YqgF family)